MSSDKQWRGKGRTLVILWMSSPWAWRHAAVASIQWLKVTILIYLLIQPTNLEKTFAFPPLIHIVTFAFTMLIPSLPSSPVLAHIYIYIYTNTQARTHTHTHVHPPKCASLLRVLAHLPALCGVIKFRILGRCPSVWPCPVYIISRAVSNWNILKNLAFLKQKNCLVWLNSLMTFRSGRTGILLNCWALYLIQPPSLCSLMETGYCTSYLRLQNTYIPLTKVTFIPTNPRWGGLGSDATRPPSHLIHISVLRVWTLRIIYMNCSYTWF